jgi:hypothetical protein
VRLLALTASVGERRFLGEIAVREPATDHHIDETLHSYRTLSEIHSGERL